MPRSGQMIEDLIRRSSDDLRPARAVRACRRCRSWITPQRRILPARPQPFEGVDGFAERDARPRQCSEIEVEPIRTEPFEASRFAGRDRVLCAGVVRIHLAYYKPDRSRRPCQRLRHDFPRRRRRRTSRPCRRGSSRDRIPAQALRFPPRPACLVLRPWSTCRGRAPARSSRPETTLAATRRSSASPCRRAYRKMWINGAFGPDSRRDASRPHSARTVVRRLSARLSGHLRHARHGRRRPCDRSPRRARPSAHRRDALHESRALPRTHVFRTSACSTRCDASATRARAASSASPWDEALATIAAKFGAIAESTDGPQAIAAVLVRRNDGSLAIRLDGSPLLPSPRRVAPRPDHLREPRARPDGSRRSAPRWEPMSSNSRTAA